MSDAICLPGEAIHPITANHLPLAFSYLEDCGPLVADAKPRRHCPRQVFDPASGNVVAQVHDSGVQQIDTAISRAQGALGQWRWRRSPQKFDILARWAHALRSNAEALAQLITLEQGKPFAESLDEVSYAASYLDWYSHEAMRPHGYTLPSHKTDSDLTVVAEPVGVVTAITPWNFPLAMPARKVSAALAAGCPVLLIPSLHTPLSALAFASLGYECGLDPALLQVLPGDGKDVVPRVLASRYVRAVTFTGSTRVGQIIGGMAGRNLQRVSLELGGHAPFIVFPDCDIDQAAEACVVAKFTTGGQDCLAANRIFLHEGIASRFTKVFVDRVASLNVGAGYDPLSTIGPMTLRSGVEHCLSHIQDALRRGAKCLTGGVALPELGENYIRPTVLSGATCDMRIWSEETFGPVAPLQTFNSTQSVLREANANAYGLAAYVFTHDAKTQALAKSVLDYGMVAINTASFTGAPIPFGGFKSSGLGKEGGPQGLEEFLRFKYACSAHAQLDTERLSFGLSEEDRCQTIM